MSLEQRIREILDEPVVILGQHGMSRLASCEKADLLKAIMQAIEEDKQQTPKVLEIQIDPLTGKRVKEDYGPPADAGLRRM